MREESYCGRRIVAGPTRTGAAIALLIVLSLVGAAHSSASAFEQPPAPGGIFGGVLAPPPEAVFPEEAQLGGLSAMAVNVSGNGGVPAGTVYAVSHGEVVMVARYSPNGSGLAFSEAWEVNLLGQPEPYERCGPDAGEPLHPHCPARTAGSRSSLGVAVDQTTGNVYVLNGALTKAGSPWITEYSADGKSIITRFGDLAAAGKTTAETPGNIHGASTLAVNAAGEVYVFDFNFVDSYLRLMVFKPETPADYEHYIYAGQEHDVAAGFLGETPVPERPVLDGAGNVYVTNETRIQEYEPGKPAEPICDFVHAAGGIVALAVNPQTGEPFYYTYKDKNLHQLSACKEGKFIETSKFARTQAAARGDISALAFDPVRKIGTRPAGTLYGGVPDSGSEAGAGAVGYIFAPAEENAPVIDSESVAKVTSSSAEVRAQINPKGFETRYLFQYLTEVAYDENTHRQKFVVAASGGTFTLSFAGKATGPLPFNASAGEVAAALEALSSVGPGNISVEGGPGDPGGTSPYLLTFSNQLSPGALPGIVADGSALTGTKPSAAVRNEFFAGGGEAPLGGADLGSGQSALAATATLSGLAAETEYRYRAIATSNCAPSDKEKVCETIGAGNSFKTFGPGAGAIPDARAYELVSPVQKNGGQVLPADASIFSCALNECKPGEALQHFPMQSAPDGEAIVYEGNPFSSEEGAVLENEYRAKRTESGWQTTNLSPRAMASKGGLGYKAFDASLDEGVLEQLTPALSPEAPPDFTNLYRQPSAEPLSLEPLITEAPPHRIPGNNPAGLKLTYAGASEDLSRVFFTANDELNGEGDGGAAAETNLYEWSTGQLHLANIGAGSETIPGAVFGSGTLLKSGNPNIPAQVLSHAISADGNRAFWTGKEGKTYVRINRAETLEVPGPGSCSENVPLASRVCFLTASADGSKVLLSNGQTYTLNEEAEAYEAGADLSQGKGGFQGIAGQSEDLSHIYFVDTAVLPGAEEDSQGVKAQATQNNLYAWVEGTTNFIGTLLVIDGAEGEGDWADSPSRRTAEASPDGGWLAFVSRAPLTGKDNTGPCTAISETGEIPCPEVFLFEAATGQLRCPSCAPSGAPPLGRSFLRINKGLPDSGPQPYYLADSGRLFFDSRDSLVPADSNGGVEDVYEFEPGEVGSCEREGGCVSLISAGDGVEDSNFLAMDESGDNVFFTTRDRLVGADIDNLIDLYDARVEGGFATKPPPPECQGEACQPQQQPPVELTPAPPGTGGNVKPPAPKHCKKNQVRRGNRCVRKSHHKKHRAKRAGHRRGGAR